MLRFIRRVVELVTAKLAWLPPLAVRIVVGASFAKNGWGKLHNLGDVTEAFEGWGYSHPHFFAAMTGTIELVGGLLLLAGLVTRLASAVLIGTMVIAIATVKVKSEDFGGVFDLLGFDETLYAAVFLWLAVGGPGPIALDRLLWPLLRGSDEKTT